MKTTVQYRIHNLSGVTTHHVRTFTDGVEDGWRKTRTLNDFLTELAARPWVSHIKFETRRAVTA